MRKFYRFVIILGAGFTLAWGAETKRVLVFNSYHPGYAWTDETIKGIQSVFLPLGKEVSARYEYMDTKLSADDEHFTNLFRLYQHKYAGLRIDLILLSDHEAFDFLMKYRQDLFPGVPLVFCGLRYFHDSLVAGQPAVTGVLQAIDYKKGIRTALQLFPKSQDVFFVCDSTPAGLLHEAAIRSVLPEFSGRAKFLFWSLGTLSMSELHQEIDALSFNDIVFLISPTKDRTGRTYPIQESIKLLSRNSPAPCFVFEEELIPLGALGGYVTSGFMQGRTAAELALRVLRGESTESIPVVKESPNRSVFEYSLLRRFRVDEKLLPPGSIVLNRSVSLYQTYRQYLFAAGGIVFFLLFTIIVMAFRLRRKK